MKTAFNISIALLLVLLVVSSFILINKVNEIEKDVQGSKPKSGTASQQPETPAREVSGEELTGAIRKKLIDQQVSEVNVKFQ